MQSRLTWNSLNGWRWFGTRDSPAFTSPVLEAQTTMPAVLSCSATVSPCLPWTHNLLTSTSRMLELQMCGGTRGFLERNRIPHRSKVPITRTVIISLISRSHLLGSDRKQVSNTGGTRLGSLWGIRVFSKAYEFCDPRVHRILTGSAPRNIQPSLSPCTLALSFRKPLPAWLPNVRWSQITFPLLGAEWSQVLFVPLLLWDQKALIMHLRSLKRTCCSIARAWQERNTLANVGTVLNK